MRVAVLLVAALWGVPSEGQEGAMAGAGCPRCLAACNLNFTRSSGRHINVHHEVMQIIAASHDSCKKLEQIAVEFPEVQLNEVTNEDILGKAYVEYASAVEFQLLSEMLELRGTGMEVVELDTPWIAPLSHHLLPLDKYVNTDKITPKTLVKDTNGRLTSLPFHSNQQVIFYRNDLLKDYGMLYPDKSWEEFEQVFRYVMEAKLADDEDQEELWGIIISLDETSPDRVTFGILTPMSGFDAGNIVDPDGRVTVNNPGTIKTLEMILRWFESNFMPTYVRQLNGWQAMQNFAAGKALAYIGWTHHALNLQEVNEEEGWDIRAGPIPGRSGAGTSGYWGVGLSAYTREPRAGGWLMQYAAQASLNATDVHPGQIPFSKDVYEDPEAWDRYCGKSPILCRSLKDYPDFWKRIVHRPSAGCASLYAQCLDLVFKEVNDILVGRKTPANGISVLETRLQKLLGQQTGPVKSNTDLKVSRIVMLVIAVLSVVVLVAIGVFVAIQVQSMGKISGLKVPTSVLLGGVVLAALATVTTIIITDSNNTTRQISEDMASRLRVQSLMAVQQAVEGSLNVALQAEVNKTTLVEIKNQAASSAKLGISRMQVDDRSLLVLIDRISNKVLMTSDIDKQSSNIILSDPLDPNQEQLSEWLFKGLKTIDGTGKHWNTALIDELKTYRLTIDGKKVSLNMQQMNAEWNLRRVSWLLLYFVPEEVIMQDANEAVERLVDTSIAFSCAALVVAVVATVIIISPLFRLAAEIDKVMVLELAEIDTTRTSFLTEMSVLLKGFYGMTEMMREYKAYMPKTIFLGVSGSDEESASNAVSASHGSSGVSKSGLSSHSNSTKGVAARRCMQVQLGKLQTVKSGVVLVSRREVFQSKMTDVTDEGEKLKTMLSFFEHASATYRGVLHTLSCVRPGEVVLSWGMVGSAASCRERACQAALYLRENLRDTAIAVNTGRAKTGNIGTAQTRGFGMIGPAVQQALAICRGVEAYAEALGRSMVVVGPDIVENFKMLPVDILQTGSRFSVLKELHSALEVGEEEWMYQMEEMNRAVLASPMAQWLDAIVQERDPKALLRFLPYQGVGLIEKLFVSRLEKFTQSYPSGAVPDFSKSTLFALASFTTSKPL